MARCVVVMLYARDHLCGYKCISAGAVLVAGDSLLLIVTTDTLHLTTVHHRSSAPPPPPTAPWTSSCWSRPSSPSGDNHQLWVSDVNVCFSAIAILDNDGNRILAKYYDTSKFPTLKEQTKFEKFLFRKTVKASNEIIMLDGLTILYRSSVDIFCYVMGSSYENELILLSALECLFTTLNNLLRKEFEKKALLGEIT